MTALQFKRLAIVALLTFAVLHGLFFWRFHEFIFRGYFDFAAFYTAGKIVQQGQSARLYDRDLQWEVQREFASSVKTRNGALPYIRPPFEALLFLPFAYLSYRSAFVAWTALNLGLLLTVLFLLRRESVLDSEILPSPWLLALLCLGFYPIASDLLQGQDAILLLLIFAVVFASLRKGSDLKAGLYLGLGLFKFHLVIPMCLVLLLKKRVRATAGFCCTAVCLLLISGFLSGWPTLAAYPRYLWSVTQSATHIGINSSVMPNVRGLLTPLIGPERVSRPLTDILLAISMLGILLAARYWRNAADRRTDRVGFSFALVTIVVTSYYTASHDLALLVLPLLLSWEIFASHGNMRRWSRTLFFISAVLLLCSPLYFLLLSFHAYYTMAFVVIAFAVSLAMPFTKSQAF